MFDSKFLEKDIICFRRRQKDCLFSSKIYIRGSFFWGEIDTYISSFLTFHKFGFVDNFKFLFIYYFSQDISKRNTKNEKKKKKRNGQGKGNVTCKGPLLVTPERGDKRKLINVFETESYSYLF